MRGRRPNGIAIPLEQWESAISPLAGLSEDCDELILRYRQLLRRHPERKALIVPGIERAAGMKGELERARAALWAWYHRYGENGEEQGELLDN